MPIGRVLGNWWGLITSPTNLLAWAQGFYFKCNTGNMEWVGAKEGITPPIEMGLDTGGLHATVGLNYRPGKATSNVNHRELLPDVIHGLLTG
jgi:hypothetical protein|uniref:Uncharacterized protein n=1 Tax=Picea glauca TaxID=3330 RepID=A0A124GMY7_PICGL|nr:hypothetical protein ABT39_MTgene6172 [Picea glauca]QHR88680.1 hypothetical protein Q903MT_gene2694 [Picea sitchensis]